MKPSHIYWLAAALITVAVWLAYSRLAAYFTFLALAIVWLSLMTTIHRRHF